MVKRLASVRRGIRYQDLVAAESLLEMVNGCDNPPSSIQLEDRRGGSFDDVVATYPDKVVWKQVKWAQHPGAEPLTIDSLASQGKGQSLIQKFAESYLKVRESGRPFQLELITNRSPDVEFRKTLSGRTSRVKTRLTKTQRDRFSAVWEQTSGLTPDQFKGLLSSVSFLVNSPDTARLENHIRTQLRLLGRPDQTFDRLMQAIWSWAEEETDRTLTQADVEQLLGVNVDTPPNAFQLSPIRVDRCDAQRELCRRVKEASSGYFVVLGSPGSGKSTLLNTLHENGVVPGGQEVVVYNCFTGTSDGFLRTRARADNFTKFLSRSLRDRYSILGAPAGATASSVETLLSRAAESNGNGRTLVVVIDGLDYARKYAPGDAESLYATLPPQLPGGVVIVVSAQVKEQLPPHLQRLEPSRILQVTPLDLGEIKVLLDAHGIFSDLSLTDIEQDDLTRQVYAATDGHALHASYACRQLVDASARGEDLTGAVTRLTASDGDIVRYYRTLFDPPSAALARDAIALMASCPFELSDDEIAENLSPTSDARSTEDALREFRHLFVRIGVRYYFCHDSLRAYAEQMTDGGGHALWDQIAFLRGLQDDPRVGDHLLHLLAEQLPGSFSSDWIDCDWLARQIAAGANPMLLRDGLQQMAFAALASRNWRLVARWWSLQACLERSENEGDLDESTLIDAWLALGRLPLIERYAFVSTQFLSKRYPAPDLIDLVEKHNASELADRLRERLLMQPAPLSDPTGFIDDFGAYARHAGRRLDPAELLPFLEARASEEQKKHENDIPWRQSIPTELVADWVDSILVDCLEAKDLDQAAAWLAIDPAPLHPDRWAAHYLELRLLRDDLSEHAPEVKRAVDVVESLPILWRVLEYGGFDKEVTNATLSFNPNPLFGEDRSWQSRSWMSEACHSLSREVAICARAGLDERLREIRSDASRVGNRLGRSFLLGLIDLWEVVAARPAEWKKAFEQFIGSLRQLRSHRFGFHDVAVAQNFVCGLGNLLGPLAIYVKDSREGAEFGEILETGLIPALVEARINYEGGHLSLSDMLDAEGLCPEIASRLRDQAEEWFDNDVVSKSGAFINLAGMQAKAGDIAKAKRTLTKGVRAAFTYGYRKDITINCFIVAFETVADRLGERFAECTDFIARAYIILSNLTDGRMLGYGSSYFIGVVCRRDLELAAKLAQGIWRSCRNLKPHWVLLAAEDQGVERELVKEAFSKFAPDVELEPSRDDEDDSEYDPRPDFSAGDGRYPSVLAELVTKVEEAIEESSYGSGFYCLPGLIKALSDGGDADSAMEVFEEFERAVRELLGPYPMPKFDIP